MFIEYPKSLYRGLNDERVANDATEEKALRAEGYAMLSDAQPEVAQEPPEAPKKRGRPAKVADAT